jgi:hypothetical protein
MDYEQITSLIARMLTCALYVQQRDDPDQSTRDAGMLLIEAAAVLEKLSPAAPLAAEGPSVGGQGPLDEPMAIIEPLPQSNTFRDPGVRDAPTLRGSKVCPKCGSHATKKVERTDAGLMLHCPVCSARWKFEPRAVWQ